MLVRSATAAIQKLGEAFPFTRNSQFVYTVSNHNSVLGVREYALKGKSSIAALLEDEVEKWIQGGPGSEIPRELFQPSEHCYNDDVLLPVVEDDESVFGYRHHSENKTKVEYNLFAYPGEDNFEGVLFPLRWIKQVQALSTPEKQWKVLLDAAAFVPKHRLNLTETPADYVCVSFYKLFGLPTGII